MSEHYLSGYENLQFNILDPEGEHVFMFIKSLLERQRFYGEYTERRHVDSLGQFRDLIEISSEGNDCLKRDLAVVRNRLVEYCKASSRENVWIGITDPRTVGAPAKFCLWVQLDGVPFGKNEFVIKQVLFKNNEVCCNIKIAKLKKIRMESNKKNTWRTKEQTSENEPRRRNVMRNKEKEKGKDNIEEDDDNEVAEWLRNVDFHETVLVVKRLVTVRRVKDYVIIFIAFIPLLVRCLASVVHNTGEFSIRMAHELNNVVKNVTPLLIALIHLVEKIIGGMYLLVAMIWRSWIQNRNNYHSQHILEANVITTSYQPQRRYLVYDHRQPSPKQYEYRNNYSR